MYSEDFGISSALSERGETGDGERLSFRSSSYCSFSNHAIVCSIVSSRSSFEEVVSGLTILIGTGFLLGMKM